MKSQNEQDAYEYVIESIVDAIAAINQVLATTRVETLKNTIEDMTATIPSMVNIPAKTNLEAVQKTIKNMTNKTNVEAIQQTIEHMAETTVDVTTILPTTEIEILKKAMENTSSSIIAITEMFLELDWDNFEPTDENVKEARDILSSEDIKVTIAEGLKEKQAGKELTPTHKTVILDVMLLYHTMIFISDTAAMTVIESQKKSD